MTMLHEVLTSRKYSPSLSLYLHMYFAVSVSTPLFLVQVTVGAGSPFTMALKKASLPGRKHTVTGERGMDGQSLRNVSQHVSGGNALCSTFLDSQSDGLACEVRGGHPGWNFLHILGDHHPRNPGPPLD